MRTVTASAASECAKRSPSAWGCTSLPPKPKTPADARIKDKLVGRHALYLRLLRIARWTVLRPASTPGLPSVLAVCAWLRQIQIQAFGLPRLPSSSYPVVGQLESRRSQGLGGVPDLTQAVANCS